MALLAAWLLPLRRVVSPGTPGVKGPAAKPCPAPAAVLRDALKLRTRDGEQAQRAMEAADAFASLLGAQADASPPSRVALGRVLRAAKGQWRTALALAAALRTPGVVTLLSCASRHLRGA